MKKEENMLQKKIVISISAIVVVSFLGFLIGFFSDFKGKTSFALEIYSDNNIADIEVLLNGSQIATIDSTGYYKFENTYLPQEQLNFEFNKSGFNIKPSKKSYIVSSTHNKHQLSLKTYAKGKPKLKIKVQDWRNNNVANAMVKLNGEEIGNTNASGYLSYPLDNYPIGSQIEIDAQKGNMYPIKGDDPIHYMGEKNEYVRNIEIYQRPDNVLKFKITDGKDPLRNVKIYSNGRAVRRNFNGEVYKHYVHDINRKYTYVFNAPGYIKKRETFTPSEKVNEFGEIVLTPIHFSVRVSDATDLTDDMSNVKIYDSNGRKIGETNFDGIARELPAKSLKQKFKLGFERSPKFPRQYKYVTITTNGQTKHIEIEPKQYTRYLKLSWENGEGITNATVHMEGEGVNLREKPDNNGQVVFRDPGIEPDREYKVTITTAYRDTMIYDTPTKFQLDQKRPRTLQIIRRGNLTINITDEDGTIELFDTQGNLLKEGKNKVTYYTEFGRYKVRCIGTVKKERVIRFNENNKRFSFNTRSDCDVLTDKINKDPNYLKSSEGNREIEQLYINISEKQAMGIELSECEANMLGRYADIKYGEEDYFDAAKAYESLVQQVEGEKLEANNHLRIGRSYLLHVDNTIGLEEEKRIEFINKSIEHFKKADQYKHSSISSTEMRRFKSELSYYRAEAMTRQYKIIRQLDPSQARSHKQNALNAWEDFLFQFDKCNYSLQQEFASEKKTAEKRITAIEGDIIIR